MDDILYACVNCGVVFAQRSHAPPEPPCDLCGFEANKRTVFRRVKR